MYGTSRGAGLGTSVGSGDVSRYPRLTANRKNPFSVAYLMCHVLVIGPVPKNATTARVRILAMRVRGPMARQKDRSTTSLVLNRSPNVRRKATKRVTRSLIFITGPPVRSLRPGVVRPDRLWHRCESSPATGAQGDQQSLSATILAPTGE